MHFLFIMLTLVKPELRMIKCGKYLMICVHRLSRYEKNKIVFGTSQRKRKTKFVSAV